MTRPHILLVTADQWPGHQLGCAGHPAIDTPTLDRLAANGVRYPNAMSECPICIPARRSLMTGTSPRIHGDRVFQPALTMPDLPLLARRFRDAGYQTGAVGKLHVYPPRDRIGFEEVISYEEGRPQLGGPDDWDIWLADRGQAGLGNAHGMSNNGYEFRPWHLDEAAHPTVWLARQMSRMIQRRDPTRPGFWHLSFNFPHPPIVPLASYLELYRDRAVPEAEHGDWAEDLPPALMRIRRSWPQLDAAARAAMLRAFYAQCTLIDHQLRVVIGTLREQGLLDDTAILFTADHGDMLGDHGLYAKRAMLAGSAGVPMILVPPRGMGPEPGRVDDRLVSMADVMPTLLQLADIAIPDTVTGRPMLGPDRHAHLYGEALEGQSAMRMVTDGVWKLIWYPAGNRMQLFHLAEDPKETRNRADDPAAADTRARLEALLVGELYGDDLDWVTDGKLTGCAADPVTGAPDRGLNGQRGLHYPEPPRGDPTNVVGAP